MLCDGVLPCRQELEERQLRDAVEASERQAAAEDAARARDEEEALAAVAADGERAAGGAAVGSGRGEAGEAGSADREVADAEAEVRRGVVLAFRSRDGRMWSSRAELMEGRRQAAACWHSSPGLALPQWSRHSHTPPLPPALAPQRPQRGGPRGRPPASRLWVDSHAPRHFGALLSDERTNREVGGAARLLRCLSFVHMQCRSALGGHSCKAPPWQVAQRSGGHRRVQAPCWPVTLACLLAAPHRPVQSCPPPPGPPSRSALSPAVAGGAVAQGLGPVRLWHGAGVPRARSRRCRHRRSRSSSSWLVLVCR
jgi:hypothetical protein